MIATHFTAWLQGVWWETGYRYARYCIDYLNEDWLWDSVPCRYYDSFCAGVACGIEDRKLNNPYHPEPYYSDCLKQYRDDWVLGYNEGWHYDDDNGPNF